MSLSLSAYNIVVNRDSHDTFLRGDSDVQQVKHWAQDPSFAKECDKEKLSYATWGKAKIIFETCTATLKFLALKIIAELANLLGATPFATRCSMHAEHIVCRMLSLKDRLMVGKDFLVTSRNLPRKKDYKFYTQPPIPLSAQGAHIKQLSKRNPTGQIDFLGNAGICSGISDWFIYLYLKTKQHALNPTEHLRAVGKIFEKGGPTQAVFLQNFPSHPLLYRHDHVREDFAKALEQYGPAQVARCNPDQCASLILRHSFNKHHPIEQKIQKIENLPPGAYKVAVKGHAMVYIKESKDLGFLYDPNIGVIKLRGPDHAQKLLEYPDIADSDRVSFDHCELPRGTNRIQTQAPLHPMPQFMPAPYFPYAGGYPMTGLQHYYWA